MPDQTLPDLTLPDLTLPSLAETGLPGPRMVAGPRDLPAALVQLADADADALADRLHDGALQALVVARYAADAAVRGADPALARDAVQAALVELRRAVWLIRPRTAEGLPAALANLSTQRAAADRPAPELDLDAEVAAGLADAAAGVAYRLVQAVLDEADGQSVQVCLSRAGDLAALDVGGALPDVVGWSLRARAVGGDLVVGTRRLRLLLPLTPGKAAP
ncbi:MAG: hypothetical protein ACR2K2_00425 [Mycobacteriales bacterium]